MTRDGTTLTGLAERLERAWNEAARKNPDPARTSRFGVISGVSGPILWVEGLAGVRSEEVIELAGGVRGMALDIDEERTGVILLDDAQDVGAGDVVHRTGEIMRMPVGQSFLGRVVDPLGRPLDGGAPPSATATRELELPAPEIMDRAPVDQPLQTGLTVVDALIPIGRGQRELILGDRQSGKTAVALDAIYNQKDTEMVCIYCAVGKRGSAVARAVDELQSRGALAYTCVVSATEDVSAGLQFAAPYAAMSLAEYFMHQGRHALVVFDDLTRHARAYREISLLLRRPPGREAYPGDIFYIHSRLLERSTRLNDELGGGSVTALPVIETEAQNLSAYIPTNLISITDGQIYLSPDLFRKGILPAVDVGKSVSRVGGKAQLTAYRAVAGDLRLAYSQFVELEAFARFGTRLDTDTRRSLERGRRVREILKQDRYSPIGACGQLAMLAALNEGLFDAVALADTGRAAELVRQATHERLGDICQRIMEDEKLDDEELERVVQTAREAIEQAVQDGDISRPEKDDTDTENETRSGDEG